MAMPVLSPVVDVAVIRNPISAEVVPGKNKNKRELLYQDTGILPACDVLPL